MCHKIGKFDEKTEMRLIMHKEASTKGCFANLLNVKPYKIIISNKLKMDEINKLKKIANKNGIKIEIFNYIKLRSQKNPKVVSLLGYRY